MAKKYNTKSMNNAKKIAKIKKKHILISGNKNKNAKFVEKMEELTIIGMQKEQIIFVNIVIYIYVKNALLNIQKI